VAVKFDDVDLVRDRDLVEQFQLGDPTAFDGLYRRYFARLYRFCHARLDDSFEAEDAAQEAFTRALTGLGSFGGERRFYAWMTVIAGNLCTDTLRRRVRTSLVDDAELDGLTEATETLFEIRLDLAALAVALAQLTPRHREVLQLREGRGWSCRQIAEHLNVQVGTAEVLLCRARAALRREFHTAGGTTFAR
jgi:RNA polymerase sigma-70 factor (ECF subfamily)